MKKSLWILVVFLMLGFCFNSNVYAGEIDVLLDVLVEQGVLTPIKAEIVRDETKKRVAEELAQGKHPNLPEWIQTTKLKGDLRLRHQWSKKDGAEDRNRGRYRFRLGLESNVADNFKVAAGLSTGGTDPRSTNQTMTNNFETADIRMDYAYAQYQPKSWATIYGGKFTRKPVLWQTGDLLWDGDINPEGVAVALTRSASDDVNLFLNTGVFVLDESSSDTSDPVMYYAQPGMKWDMGDGMSLKMAVALYGFNSLKGKGNLDHSAGTNSLDAAGNLMYDYNTINPEIELSIKEPLGGLVPYAAMFGQYVHNPNPANEGDGYLAGIKFGAKKVKKSGQWQAKYMYRRLEKDAWIDAYPDSDSYGGETGIKGHEVVFTYGLAKNVTLGLDYYYMENITGPTIGENIVQTDVEFKF
ncbi:MAG: putative porin [Candidatus Zapsychrus exili]|nr:putative porin [Candidatus Zapsychrus exili]